MLFSVTGYFYHFNAFSSDNCLGILFSSSTIVDLSRQTKWKFLRLLHWWFDVISTYLFQSMGLLYMSIYIPFPVLLILISKNGKYAVFLPIVNCKIEINLSKITRKSFCLNKLLLKKIGPVIWKEFIYY